jgi:hypothetical protein
MSNLVNSNSFRPSTRKTPNGKLFDVYEVNSKTKVDTLLGQVKLGYPMDKSSEEEYFNQVTSVVAVFYDGVEYKVPAVNFSNAGEAYSALMLNRLLMRELFRQFVGKRGNQ